MVKMTFLLLREGNHLKNFEFNQWYMEMRLYIFLMSEL